MYIYITKKDKNKAILKVTLFYTYKTCNNHKFIFDKTLSLNMYGNKIVL